VEKKIIRKIAKSKFNASTLGSNVGSMWGPAGRILGGAAGKLFKTVTGYGEYKVNTNSLITSAGDTLPMFKNAHVGTNVRHREYIGDVITSGVIGQFKIDKFVIQPGLLASFPWLAAGAENYEEYTLNGMVVEFKSNSYDALASTNTASGTVILTTQYNVYEPDFINKLQMEQYEFTCSCKPSISIVHPVECARLETPTSVLRIRNASVQGDLGLYDWGNFYIATVGMQGASTNIGELWLSYDITLIKPKLRASSDVGDHWIIPSGNLTNMSTTALNYFGRAGTATVPAKTPSSDLGTTISPSGITDAFSLDTINFPPSYFGNVAVMVRWYRIDPLSAVGLPNHGYTFQGGVLPNNLLTGGDYTLQGYPGVSMFVCNDMGQWEVIFLTVTNGGSIIFHGGGGLGAVTRFDLLVVAMPLSLM